MLHHIPTGHSLDLSFLRLFIEIHTAIDRAPRSLGGEGSSPIYRTLLIVWFFIPVTANFTAWCMHESRINLLFTITSTVALPPLAWSLCLLKQRQFPLSVSSLQHLSNISPTSLRHRLLCDMYIGRLLSISFILIGALHLTTMTSMTSVSTS